MVAKCRRGLQPVAVTDLLGSIRELPVRATEANQVYRMQVDHRTRLIPQERVGDGQERRPHGLATDVYGLRSKEARVLVTFRQCQGIQNHRLIALCVRVRKSSEDRGDESKTR